MNSLLKLQEEAGVLKKDLDNVQEETKDLDIRLKVARSHVETLERDLYEKNIRILHIKEIYRTAKQQFSRLRNETEPVLSEADMAELEKWVGRAKSHQGLIDILEAIQELNKYYPHDIKSNLYALVQRIIIGGAYKRRPNE
jgi:chromosome segregation ATPase